MTLLVRKMGKFMKKKGYGARKRRDYTKNKEYVRRCYNCKSPDHVVADCPYNSDNNEDEKKKEKKQKKEKKIVTPSVLHYTIFAKTLHMHHVYMIVYGL